ncbi:hypothetical protein [Salicibibacter halophilus]|uniref:hypothetical protein n=1 Tax=Salicibibacter halophilus TaxID=2502791 RepID=UPI001357233E|nr:hypothetical protein [Salicibibacter halophilus]
MPKLEIKLNERGKEKVKNNNITEMRDYDFLVDGYEIPALQHIKIDFSKDELPTASFDFSVGEVEIDAETVNAIKTIIDLYELD